MRATHFLAALLVLLLASTASAAITVQINNSDINAGTAVYYPNLSDADKCVDLNITVWDTNAANTIHRWTLVYTFRDANVAILNDENIGTGECSFVTDDNWSAGADCVQTYCWSSNNQLTSGTYPLFFEVDGGNSGVLGSEVGGATQNVTLDFRFVSTAISALLQAIPIVLVAAIIIVAVLGLTGVVSPRTVVVLLPSLILVLIALIVVGRLMLTVEGKA